MLTSTALYYPHSKLENLQHLKTALVLFDKVEWLAPDKLFKPYYENRICAEVMELIGDRHIPDDKEREIVHEEVLKLVSKPLPDWFVFRPVNKDLRYQILPDKFSYKTWKLLLSSDFVNEAKEPVPNYKGGAVFDYEVSSALGLTLMGILANVCAGTTKRKFTDEEDGYAALNHVLIEDSELEFIKPDQKHPKLETYERLVTLSCKTLNCDKIPFNKLIELRKEEDVKKNDVLKQARKTYFKALDEYAQKLTNEVKLPADVKAFEDAFCSDLEEKLSNLKIELGIARRRLITKDIFTLALVAAGALVEPFTSTLIGTAMVAKQTIDHNVEQREKIKANPTGWLYMHKKLQFIDPNILY